MADPGRLDRRGDWLGKGRCCALLGDKAANSDKQIKMAIDRHRDRAFIWISPPRLTLSDTEKRI
jgi:hypothetical protein